MSVLQDVTMNVFNVFVLLQSPVKRQILTAKTQAYDMATGIDPTMGYDMEADDKPEVRYKPRSLSLQYQDKTFGLERISV